MHRNTSLLVNQGTERLAKDAAHIMHNAERSDDGWIRTDLARRLRDVTGVLEELAEAIFEHEQALDLAVDKVREEEERA